MSTRREEVLELVAQGKVSPADADELLKAIERPRTPLWRWIFLPLEHVSTRGAIAVACVAAVAQIAAARWWGIRFDGALDVHLSSGVVPWRLAFVELGIDWAAAIAVFWAASRVVARQGRLIDFVGAVGFARVPLLLTAVVAGLFRDQLAVPMTASGAPSVSGATIAVAFAMLPLVVWSIVLFVTGFRAASGLRGVKLGLTVAGAIVAAELLSKIMITLLA